MGSAVGGASRIHANFSRIAVFGSGDHKQTIRKGSRTSISRESGSTLTRRVLDKSRENGQVRKDLQRYVRAVVVAGRIAIAIRGQCELVPRDAVSRRRFSIIKRFKIHLSGPLGFQGSFISYDAKDWTSTNQRQVEREGPMVFEFSEIVCNNDADHVGNSYYTTPWNVTTLASYDVMLSCECST